MGVPYTFASFALFVVSVVATDECSVLQVDLQTSGDLKPSPAFSSTKEQVDDKKNINDSSTKKQTDDKKQVEDNNGDFCGYKNASNASLTNVLINGNGDDFLIDLTAAFTNKDSIHVMFTVMLISGQYHDGVGYSATYASPMEESRSALYELKLNKWRTKVEVHHPQMEVRTTDDQMKTAMKRGLGSSFAGSFAVLICSGSSLLSSKRIVIRGQDLLSRGFMVAPSLGSSPIKPASFKLLKVASFPKNLDVSVEVSSYSGSNQAGFSMIVVPETSMVPRLADDRLLYFTTDYTDLGTHPIGKREAPVRAANRDVSIIWRYNLAALPDHQIKIYIDPSVPKRWREIFREGVDAWKDAYAYAGWPNAIRGVLPEDKDWPKDYDVSDARFSAISWVVSNRVVSMGIAKVDPRSGEIIKSDIIMSDGWVKAWLGDLDLLDPNVTYTLDSHSDFHTELRSRTQSAMEVGLLAVGSEILQQNIIAQGLKSVIMHEVGHILGLRHNFKGSMGVSYECTQDMSCSAKNGLTSSVMDYLPMNLAADPSKPVHAFTPVVGAYDKAAIRYGYMAADDKTTMTTKTRPAELLKVVQEAENFQTCYDGDIQGQDPGCMPYDFSGDPLSYFEAKLNLIASRQKEVLANSVLPGRSYKNVGNAAHTLLFMAGNAGLKIMEWIGGMNNTYGHRGLDGGHTNAMLRKPVPVEMQRRALKLVLRIIHAQENGFVPKPEDMKYLVAGSSIDTVTSEDISYDLRRIASALSSNLLSTKAVMRLYSQETFDLDASQGFTVGEMLATVQSTLFARGLDKVSANDWNSQEYFISSIIYLHKLTSLPAAVRAEVDIQIQRTDSALSHALKALQARKVAATSAAESVSDQAFKAPADDELLHAHLLGMHEELYRAVCASASECILPSWSGAQATVPAMTALSLIAVMLGTQIFG